MKALINENNVVTQVEATEFEVASPMYWVDCDDTIKAYDYEYNNGVFTEISHSIDVPVTAEHNEMLAKDLLRDCDWVKLSDVSLSNSAEWDTYRAALRAIVKNPTADATIPTKPDVIWA